MTRADAVTRCTRRAATDGFQSPIFGKPLTTTILERHAVTRLLGHEVADAGQPEFEKVLGAGASIGQLSQLLFLEDRVPARLVGRLALSLRVDLLRVERAVKQRARRREQPFQEEHGHLRVCGAGGAQRAHRNKHRARVGCHALPWRLGDNGRLFGLCDARSLEEAAKVEARHGARREVADGRVLVAGGNDARVGDAEARIVSGPGVRLHRAYKVARNVRHDGAATEQRRKERQIVHKCMEAAEESAALVCAHAGGGAFLLRHEGGDGVEGGGREREHARLRRPEGRSARRDGELVEPRVPEAVRAQPKETAGL
eukprot:5558792-Pleurochrysis_carterae.AAC.2